MGRDRQVPEHVLLSEPCANTLKMADGTPKHFPDLALRTFSQNINIQYKRKYTNTKGTAGGFSILYHSTTTSTQLKISESDSHIDTIKEHDCRLHWLSIICYEDTHNHSPESITANSF